jgi:arylsulfatase A-like enzyme
LLLSYPRAVAAGAVHDGIVTNVDFAPTILEFAGVTAHERMQGRSFAGDLTGADAAPPAAGMYYRYWEHDDRFHHAPAHYGYRTERYKLIYYYNDGMGLPGTGPLVYPGEWELYDLDVDPTEMRNVAGDPAYAGIRAELETALLAEQRRLGDEPHPSQRSAG